MTPLLDVFVLTMNEEELLKFCLDSYVSIADLIGTCSIVDNNSTDATLDIIASYKDKLPITLQHHRTNSHHGEMRTKAMSVCKSPWIFYLDSDETFTKDMRDWLLSGAMEDYDWIQFFKYTTIVDCNHFVPGGNGYTQRLFRNYPGVHFPQSIHTEPTAGWTRKASVPESSVLLFDHTACKSKEALWAKGWRYQWAAREKVVGIGPISEYVWRVETAYKNNAIELFSKPILDKIFTGPA